MQIYIHAHDGLRTRSSSEYVRELHIGLAPLVQINVYIRTMHVSLIQGRIKSLHSGAFVHGLAMSELADCKRE